MNKNHHRATYQYQENFIHIPIPLRDSILNPLFERMPKWIITDSWPAGISEKKRIIKIGDSKLIVWQKVGRAPLIVDK
jgi:hypothetical protein